MKRFFAILFVAAICPVFTSGAITFVGTLTENESLVGVTTLTSVNTGLAISNGDCIVVFVRGASATGTFVVTDNQNKGNYRVGVLQQDGTNGRTLLLAYMSDSVAISAGSLTVTITMSTSQNAYISGAVYRGVAQYDPLDQTNGNAFTTATATPSSGNITTTVSGDVVIGAFLLSTGTTATVSAESTGFTSRLSDTLGTTTHLHAHLADDILTGTSTIAYAPTLSASTTGVIAEISLKPQSAVTYGGGISAPSQLVQHVSGSSTTDLLVAAGTTYNLPLPNATLTGNAVICGVTFGNTASTVTLHTATNGTNTDLMTQGATATDSTNGAITQIWYKLAATAGANSVNVLVNTNNAAFVSASCSEFSGLGSATDGSSGNNATGSSVSAGSITTTTDGDLIYQYTTVTGGAGPYGATDSWTTASPWSLLHADTFDGTSAQAQIQTTHGAITPTITMFGPLTYISVALAVKTSAGAGTARPGGIRVLRLQHNNSFDENHTSFKMQAPTDSGNLLVMGFGGGTNYQMTALADTQSNAWTIIGTSTFVTNGDTAQNAYVPSASVSQSLDITVTLTNVNAGSGGTFLLYEITGAANSPLDTGFGSTASANGNQTTSGNVTTFTATPSAQNELIIVSGSMQFDSMTTWASPSGAQVLGTYHTPGANNTHADENNPWGLLYNGSSTAAETWTFAHDTAVHPFVGGWAVFGSAFSPSTGAKPACFINLLGVGQC